MTESLEIGALNPLRLPDRSLLEGYFFRYRKAHCEYNFSTLYTWDGTNRYLWTVYKGRLLIYTLNFDTLIMPVGEDFSPKELREISDAFRLQGSRGGFLLADKEYVQRHQGELGTLFSLEEDRDNGDYVYLTEELAELKGRKFHGKKNLLNQFLKEYPDYSFRPATSEDGDLCVALAEKWCRVKVCDRPDFAMELSAVKRSFDAFDGIGLGGVLLFVSAALVGFSLYSRQREEMVTVHFEKADPEVKGSAQGINWLTARQLRGQCLYLNREQDMGLEGLRQAKLSYHPNFLVETYRLSPLG